jgi:hypothetical protein
MKKFVKHIAIVFAVVSMVMFSTAAFAGHNYSIYGDSIFSDSEKTEKKAE